MEKTQFLGAENELQKIYSNLGVMVPVGDLSQGKAPAVQVLPSTSTLDSITFNFNVTSSADITSIAYETSSQQTGTITPKKGVVSVTFDSLDYNTELEISLYVTNASGTTTVYTAAETQHYTNWATADEVFEGNKFIGEDGQEAVGTYVPTKAAIGADSESCNKYQIMGTLMTNGDFLEVDGFDLTIQEPSEYAGITIYSNGVQRNMKIGENEYVFYQEFKSLPPGVTDLSGNGTIIVATSTDPMNPLFDEYPITWTCAQTESFTPFTLSNCTLTQVTAPDQSHPYGEWQFSGTSDQDMTQIGLDCGKMSLYASDNSTIATIQLEPIDPNDPYTVKSSTFSLYVEITSASGMYAIEYMYNTDTWDFNSFMPWGTYTVVSLP